MPRNEEIDAPDRVYDFPGFLSFCFALRFRRSLSVFLSLILSRDLGIRETVFRIFIFKVTADAGISFFHLGPQLYSSMDAYQVG